MLEFYPKLLRMKINMTLSRIRRMLFKIWTKMKTDRSKIKNKNKIKTREIIHKMKMKFTMNE